ncbi:hypothetical protein O4J56_29020 [Nocardiopsis sp. RSe5-2]|uniref:DUF4064 domain-containing protein n=1 Tax=Nocardiopsis endophytica TaxID=3018445 RepID=A0ABT4UCN0_9ACTN|nr:hypothetical protein [Nocardiopsis endophytica]MDA2814721.1 hypothetical protein [Nocardiopsis endophytica]
MYPQYPQHAPYGYAPAPPQGPPPLPGTVTAVRVLMFLGGLLGVLFGAGVAVLFGAMLGVDPRQVEDLSDAQEVALQVMAEEGIDPAAMAVVLGLAIGIPVVTGLISMFLSAVAGRRSRLWLWSIVAFQAFLALGWGVQLLALNLLAVIPLVLCIVKIALITGTRARQYYAS